GSNRVAEILAARGLCRAGRRGSDPAGTVHGAASANAPPRCASRVLAANGSARAARARRNAGSARTGAGPELVGHDQGLGAAMGRAQGFSARRLALLLFGLL